MDWLTQKFELSRGGSAGNVRPMEGLRGFAVFLVFIVHFTTLVKPWAPSNTEFSCFLDGLHTIGNSGVDLFFVLSGYLIYGSLLKRPQAFPVFFSRRIVRIYPAFTAVFLLYIVLSYIFPAESKIPADALPAATYLLQNYLLLPGLFPIEPMITVAWSLSYEMFYYLAIPFVIAAFKLRNRSALWRITSAVMLAILLAACFAQYGGPVRILMFVSGVLVWEIRNIGAAKSLGSGSASVALVAGLLLVLIPLDGYPGEVAKTAMLFFTFLILCLVCFNHPRSWLPRMFSWTPARWLGNMSYSYYLLHGLALKAGFLVLGKVIGPASHSSALFWILLPTMFVATLLPASVLFLMIERPLSLVGEQARTRVTVKL